MPRAFLGGIPLTGQPFDLSFERHLLTIAGSGAGKGACLIIPNLLRWPDSVVVVDPKGEAAERTARHRADTFGQAVAVLDPYGYGAGIEEFRATFNPLDLVASVDDLFMLADGLVFRTANESQPHWPESAAGVLAGLMAYILSDPYLSDDERHLGQLRPLLRVLQDKRLRADLLADMRASARDKCGDPVFGGLAADVAARLSKDTNETASILSTVDTQTRWLASPEMSAMLSAESSVDLRALKRGKLSLFLVLPPQRLETHGRFLRLFVRCALSVMWEKIGAAQRGTPCLFVLDEFAALGRIDEIRTAGLQQGRSFGLHVWPFVVDWGQLVSVYGREEAATFTGSADAVAVFGVEDWATLQEVARWFGVNRDTMATPGHANTYGSPVMTPEELKALIGKPEGAAVARRMVAFIRGRGHPETLIPWPWFSKHPPGWTLRRLLGRG
jgi:type IV secretion system protein VirD4